MNKKEILLATSLIILVGVLLLVSLYILKSSSILWTNFLLYFLPFKHSFVPSLPPNLTLIFLSFFLQSKHFLLLFFPFFPLCLNLLQLQLRIQIVCLNVKRKVFINQQTHTKINKKMSILISCARMVLFSFVIIDPICFLLNIIEFVLTFLQYLCQGAI